MTKHAIPCERCNTQTPLSDLVRVEPYWKIGITGHTVVAMLCQKCAREPENTLIEWAQKKYPNGQQSDLRPFSAGMSTPATPAPTESRPSPWLTMVVPIVVTMLGLAVQWGTLGSDVRHLDRRVGVVKSEVARVSATQATAATQSARIEACLDGMERELSQLARAVERLNAAPAAAAHELR